VPNVVQFRKAASHLSYQATPTELALFELHLSMRPLLRRLNFELDKLLADLNAARFNSSSEDVAQHTSNDDQPA
jgi:hypothetical protein